MFATDAPLGCPTPLRESLIGHRAGEPIHAESNDLFRRTTDRFVHATLGKLPLDVGADRIARTAHSALRLLGQLRSRLGRDIPLSWSPSDGDGLSAIEVYPAATLISRKLNAVGGFDGGPLGRLSVHSDKWGESDFDRMLGEIAGHLAILPFAATTGAERALEHRGPAAHRVLYHAFVYLRYLLSPTALPDDRLAVALRLIISRPHRRLRRVTQWSPLGALRSIEPRALLAAVTARAALCTVLLPVAPRPSHARCEAISPSSSKRPGPLTCSTSPKTAS